MRNSRINLTLAKFTIGYALSMAILFFVINSNSDFYTSIIYHYSNSYFWYFLCLLIPLMIALLFTFLPFIERIASSFKRTILLFGRLMLSMFIVLAIANNYYWGYPFIRPQLFKELNSAEKINTITLVESDGSSHLKLRDYDYQLTEVLYGRKDPYYGIKDRIFMLFQDKSHTTPHLSEFPEIFKDTSLNLSNDQLKIMSDLIIRSNIVDKGTKGWDTSGKLNGLITEFVSNKNEIFYFASLNGGEVSNDHWPAYEFLFKKTHDKIILIKKQRFYTDVAGFENVEFAYVYPYFSGLISLLLLMTLLIGFFLKRIHTQRV